MSTPAPFGFATAAIHHGYDPQDHEGALTPPLHLTSTFAFESAEDGAARFSGEAPGHVYSRISNPTVDLLERRIAHLEGAEAALGTASGMGAITATLWTLLRPGDEILTDMTLYGCTFAFMQHGLGRFGIRVTHVDMTDIAAVEGALGPDTRLVYFETPANPNMRLVDIQAVCALARAHGAWSVVDNTYATPVITRPIALGADFVVHSATKYLGGHGDLVAGMVLGRAADIQQIRLFGVKDMTGAVLSPFNAMLILRGLKTLELRVQRHAASAQAIAERLQAHPAVHAVHYPGLESFPQYDLAQRQMALPGGMIAFRVRGGYEAGKRVMNRLTLIQRAVSLGDAETLIQHPASMTHSTYPVEQLIAHGIMPDLVRLSVGLEDVRDIWADLGAALDAERDTLSHAA
ncbi:methionine gamma-lyase [Sphingomonas sp. Sph1(2015)]|jgi:methionine-gamma-lyase|uniref:methionine gamma-lyase n=1 Tax=Sphingomonas sp. Sph1(2015) TaxID=1628084 RepID=UPI00097631A5|nr:methionine gamma-lyase [Sphingomonas sp. Sph1(2015)]OMJ30658.1 methionine gamma-lyase [Sphingomonas sp. Sph1(2015)]